MRRLSTILALLATLAAPTRAQQAPAGGTIAIRAARLIDGTGAPVVRNGVVVVTADRIVAAGPSTRGTIPAGARIIALGEATRLPGFIDAPAHAHGRTLSAPQGGVEPGKGAADAGAI